MCCLNIIIGLMVRVTSATRNLDINSDCTQVSLVTSKPFSLSFQPHTAFAELRYGRRDFSKKEGRKTEKGKVGRVAEGEVGG